MKKDFQKHINIVLPVIRSILQSTINVIAERELDVPDKATIPFWKEAYYSLVLLEKILRQFPDFLQETHQELETQESFNDAVGNCITQNLVSAIYNMHSFKGHMEFAALQNFWSTLGQHDQGLFLRAFQLLDSSKGKGLFLSIISGACGQNDRDPSGDFQYLLVSNLLKKMGKIALQKEAIQMKIIFNTFRLISSEISLEYCQRYAFHMLPSLYKVCEGFAGKDIPDDLKQLAQEVSDKIRNTLGSQNFVEMYNEIRKNVKTKRDKRRQETKLMAVVNPMRNAKRKLRNAAKHPANKKRKTMTMKMGRWFTLRY